MSVRSIVAVALSASVIAVPLLVSQANADTADRECQAAVGTAVSGASAAAGAAPGTGLGEGSVSTNSSSSDWAAVQRAAQANDPGATSVAGVWPLDVPAQPVPAVNPSNGAGPALTPAEHAELNTALARGAVRAPAAYAVAVTNTAYAGGTIDRRSFSSVTDCLNVAARVHAPLARCER
jgi:hypothetical protein